MSTLDYAGWVQRATAFVRSLPERMPSSEVELSLQVVAPRQISTMEFLPADLQRLYQEGATEIRCRYSLVARQKRLYGGPSWISPEKIPGLKREYDSFYADVLDASWDEKSAYIVQNFIPFIDLTNGDLVAIDSNPDKNSIYYVAHDDYSTELASNLENFLQEWEKCCYIDPESWMLREHAGLKEGALLSGDTPEAKNLSEFLRRNG